MTADRTTTLSKRATGIPGLDAVTHGGLPAGGAVLVLGESGAGKTVLGLNILARAVERGEGGVFVSFEETTQQARRDAGSFEWGERLDAADRCELIDARPPAGAAAAGGFDLEGLLAAVGAAVQRLEARWLVLDGIDQLLRLQPGPHDALEQIAGLDRWCEAQGVTLLLTGKRSGHGGIEPAFLAGVEFMLATVIVLSAEVFGRRLNRRFRIAKYRGTAHATDELAMVIDAEGIHLPYEGAALTAPAASSERIGSGIERLDRVLDGGIYRGSTTLISGAPGTAKTTLAAAFAQAAAERGERALYVSFDELADRIVRNVASVGIDLAPHVDAGRIDIRSRAAWGSLVEEHFIEIQRLLERHEPHCLVIDPVSALLKANSAEIAYLAIERLLAGARAGGVTTVLTSLVDVSTAPGETTMSHVSTLADTWITLDYTIHGGERNRALSVVKSRGAAHSNQVRELVLSAEGVDLADVYELGSEVLMGTARMQRKSEEAARLRRQRLEREQHQHDLERRIEQARARARDAEHESARLQAELEREREDYAEAERDDREHRADVMRRRGSARPGTEPGDPQ